MGKFAPRIYIPALALFLTAAAAPALHLALRAATASTRAAWAGLAEIATATSACLVASLAK